MEQPLRCNNQTGGYCRAVLTEEAVVTTCSHVFCIACSKKIGLSDARLDQRICPVCSTRLPNADDAVQTRLNPTEEYKTSVLSGLDPTAIIECAGRALAFWTYQTTQEISYQQHVTKNLTERYSHLSAAMDKVIHDANSEIQGLQSKIAGLSVDHKTLGHKYAEVVDLYREKSRKHAQAQKLYDTLKQKYQAGQMQSAASANVAQAIGSIEAERRPDTFTAITDPRPKYHRPADLGLDERTSRPQINQATVEQLHPHQRSGSSAVGSGSELMGMAPPERPRASRIPNLQNSATPMHRVALPGSARNPSNRSQIPMSTSRANMLNTQNMPTLARDHQLHKISGSTQNHGVTTSGVRIGRAGTAGSLDMASRFDQYRAPELHASHHADSHGHTTLPFPAACR